MITKGIVEKIVDQYQIRVRMPFIDGLKDTKQSTPTENLSVSTICALPKHAVRLQEGDIVFLGFEDNDIGKPVILGQLYRDAAFDSICDIEVGNITVNGVCNLSSNTTIGEITPTQLRMLSGVTCNIQAQLDDIYDKLNQLQGGS